MLVLSVLEQICGNNYFWLFSLPLPVFDDCILVNVSKGTNRQTILMLIIFCSFSLVVFGPFLLFHIRIIIHAHLAMGPLLSAATGFSGFSLLFSTIPPFLGETFKHFPLSLSPSFNSHCVVCA